MKGADKTVTDLEGTVLDQPVLIDVVRQLLICNLFKCSDISSITSARDQRYTHRASSLRKIDQKS